MIIKKQSVWNDSTSCNFCDKGILNISQTGLVYPYEHVVTFIKEGSGIRATICEDCLYELNIKGNEHFNKINSKTNIEKNLNTPQLIVYQKFCNEFAEIMQSKPEKRPDEVPEAMRVLLGFEIFKELYPDLLKQ